MALGTACGCELEEDEVQCDRCGACEVCCECDDAFYDADELGLDPEVTDVNRLTKED